MDMKRKSPRRRKPRGQGNNASQENERFEELAKRINALEKSAFVEFAEFFGPVLRSHFIKNRKVPVCVAEEVTGICITEIPYKTLTHYKKGNYFGWVFTVAGNILNDWLRTNRQRMAATVPLMAEEVNYGEAPDEFWLPVTRLMMRVEQGPEIPDSSTDCDTEPHRCLWKSSDCAPETGFDESEENDDLDPNLGVISAVKDALEKLSVNERAIIERYDLCGAGESESLREIADSIGVSHGNARQIHRRALEKLELILKADTRITTHPRLGRLLDRDETCTER